jgi:pimeloyl-ACP methyl ester carboxylesterase
MSTHTVSINGIDLVYEKEGSGPPLVFFHGGNASAVWCQHLIPHLMRGYTCYALEQRGHGRSARSLSGEYNISAFIDDAVEFLDRVSGPATLVGWSLGGVVSMAAAARRPDLVKAIFLEDSVPQVYAARRQSTTGVPAFFGLLAPVAERKERESSSLVEHMLNIGSIPVRGSTILELWPPQQLAQFARDAYGTASEYYRQVADFRAALADETCDAIPAGVRCPVHLLYGDIAAGSVVNPEDIDELRRLGVELSVTHIPGAPHGIAMPFAREFIDDLKAFLAGLPE